MIDIMNVQRSIDLLKGELLDSIKERIIEIAGDSSIQLYPICVTDGASHSRGVRNTMEIRNVYAGDDGTPCGDFATLNEGIEAGVAFGKPLANLFVEDLYKILFSLHGRGWQVEAPPERNSRGAKRGMLKREMWKNRLQRRGA